MNKSRYFFEPDLWSGDQGRFWQRPARGFFLLFTVAAGASLVLAETCQPGNSTPRFLAAQRSAVSSRREEVAGVAARLAQPNKRAAALLKSWEFSTVCAEKKESAHGYVSTLFLVCNCVRFCFVYNDLRAERQISGAGRRGDRLALHAPPRFGVCG